MDPIRLIVSRCLLGDAVRYDNKSKPANYVCENLAKAFELVPVCPEFESGLGLPREAMKLCGNAETPELRGVVSNKDCTGYIRSWLEKRLPELAALEPAGFVLKSSSPSCGLYPVQFQNSDQPGTGLFAACVATAFPELAIASEKQLEERFGRQKFLDKLLLMTRFRELTSSAEGVEMLPDFHCNLKLCAMSHAPGRMAELEKFARRGDWGTYERKLAVVLDAEPEQSKHNNVWRHLQSVLMARSDDYERTALLRSMREFEQGELDFKAMLMLLRIGVEKYAPEYQSQFYWRMLDPLY
ncbi:MAG: DUF1722 domain-containing protein [Lentisphaeria bacterium]|nr:DUF1722 domain-containing protein [Lentisphaeria bacterium]